ncbi:hypothetical protein QWZ16_23850 [Vibrio ostreicida]|uniref:Uncharacterized protein n=1 Tax=Vibrio ostreicida TaxID=526588 RepID=A0ABT8BZV8_9VIBR|nr:hypothetical protein [Vibrio ostreicida]MDN3612631.1 hypothetical protein [Vibrio ostreicida]
MVLGFAGVCVFDAIEADECGPIGGGGGGGGAIFGPAKLTAGRGARLGPAELTGGVFTAGLNLLDTFFTANVLRLVWLVGAVSRFEKTSVAH